MRICGRGQLNLPIPSHGFSARDPLKTTPDPLSDFIAELIEPPPRPRCQASASHVASLCASKYLGTKADSSHVARRLSTLFNPMLHTKLVCATRPT